MIKVAKCENDSFFYDDESRELICGNCCKRVKDSDVMQRFGSIWFCRECAKPANLTARALKEVIKKP